MGELKAYAGYKGISDWIWDHYYIIDYFAGESSELYFSAFGGAGANLVFSIFAVGDFVLFVPAVGPLAGEEKDSPHHLHFVDLPCHHRLVVFARFVGGAGSARTVDPFNPKFAGDHRCGQRRDNPVEPSSVGE